LLPRHDNFAGGFADSQTAKRIEIMLANQVYRRVEELGRVVDMRTLASTHGTRHGVGNDAQQPEVSRCHLGN
jgi:hypothetical protein